MSEATAFGKYTLLRKIAEGGMAEIYLALQTGRGGFEKLLVIKRIRPSQNQDKDFISMFLDEARIAASLSHPNVVQIFDVGDEASVHYIAMEYVHGEDLRSLCRKLAKDRRPLPLAHAISMLAGACAGLHYAHTKTDLNGQPLEIVHRDVSPQNLIISYDGHVKLVDFGIAKAAGRSSETRVGVLKGKISYMSPEQVRGDKLDARSDVFAIGILLYELTTGKRLYKDDSDFKTMRKITDEPPTPPREIIPAYPAGLEEIVLKTLAKDPNDRYESAQALQQALETFARQEAIDTSNLALGAFMRDVFKDKLAEQARQEALGKPLHQILAERQGTESVLTENSGAGSASMARGELNPPGSKKGRAKAIVLSGLAAAVLLGGGFFGYPYVLPYLSSKPAQVAAAQTPATTPASQVATVDAVPRTIEIRSDPAGAEAFHEGVSIGKTPTSLTIRSDKTLHLRLKADGFADETLERKVEDVVDGSVFVLFDNPLKPAVSDVSDGNKRVKGGVVKPPKGGGKVEKPSGGSDDPGGSKAFPNPFDDDKENENKPK